MVLSLVGAGIGALGGILSAREKRKAAEAAASGAEFTPFNVNSLSGSALFNNGNLNLRSNDATRGLFTGFQGLAGQPFLDQESALEFAGSQAQASIADAGGFRRLGNDFFNAESIIPDAAFAAAGRFGELEQGVGALGAQGLDAAFNGMPSALGLSQGAAGLGAGFLGTDTSASFNQLASERLASLRQAARPGEERAVNSRINNLFNTGRLGTTGGQNAIGELALQEELADQNRILSAQQFAQNQLRDERAFSTGQQQLGANLLGLGIGGINNEQQVGLRLGDLGKDLTNMRADLITAGLGAFGTGDNAQFSRAASRMEGAQKLFGFGEGLRDLEIDRALQALGATQSIESGLLGLGKTGGSLGQAQASAGFNAGQLRMQGAGSIFGAALTGLAQDDNFFTGLTNLFGKDDDGD